MRETIPYIHIYIYTYIHKYISTYIHIYINTYMRETIPYIYERVYTHIYERDYTATLSISSLLYERERLYRSIVDILISDE